MSYADRESSLFDAQPVEVYRFTRGAINWRYTSADEDQVIQGVPYIAYQIKRGAIEQNQEMSRSPLTLHVDKNLPFLAQFRGSPPTDVIQLTIHRYHEGEGDEEDITTPWVGRVVNVKFGDGLEAEVKCEPVYTSLRRPTLRRRYQRTCPHVLYGIACGVPSNDFAVQTALGGVSGRTLSAAEFGLGDGYFAGGYVDWEQGGVLERRFIVEHVGTGITVNLPFAGIASGDTVRAYPGCDHLMTTCNAKFSNVENYGGQPFYPQKNPMTGNPIF